jgi:hypothetical protein
MHDDDYGNTLGTFNPDTSGTKRKKKAPREYEVKELRDTVTGRYFKVNVFSVSGDPVVVKNSTRFGTFVCLTCLTADQCAHSAAARQFAEDTAPATVRMSA